MKKRRIIYAIICICIIFFSTKILVKEEKSEIIIKDIEYKMGPAGANATSYHDFSELKTLNTKY